MTMMWLGRRSAEVSMDIEALNSKKGKLVRFELPVIQNGYKILICKCVASDFPKLLNAVRRQHNAETNN